jgi:chorismate mutase
MTLRALRGATTFDVDEKAHVQERVIALLQRMTGDNDVDHDDIVSILFTATSDLHSMFPASAAREIGYGDVPLICAQELDITGATRQCIRVMMHLHTERARADLHHVYLEGAVGLRDDLPG